MCQNNTRGIWDRLEIVVYFCWPQENLLENQEKQGRGKVWGKKIGLNWELGLGTIRLHTRSGRGGRRAVRNNNDRAWKLVGSYQEKPTWCCLCAHQLNSLSCARCFITSSETEEALVSYKTPLILWQQLNSLSIMQNCSFSPCLPSWG